MRLVVYARSLTDRPTGRGVVPRELLPPLLRLDPSLEVHLFCGSSPGIDGCRVWPARGSGPLSDAWRLFRGAGRDIRSLAPDLVWSATHLLPGGLPDTVPIVVTALDTVWKDCPETMNAANRLASRWSERNLERADRIVCISAFTQSRVATHWPHLSGRTEVISLASNPRLKRTPTSDDELLRTFGINVPFILTVGTLEPRKNLGLLLDAAARIPDLIFVHAGPVGWKTGDVLERARRLANVRLLGYREEHELAALYSRALAAVFPSRYEGFHLPVIDAAALGCPVLLSDIPAHREVMEDAAGYFPADAPDAAAERIRELRESPGRREDLGRKAEERARTFSWDRSAGLLIETFRRAAAGR